MNNPHSKLNNQIYNKYFLHFTEEKNYINDFRQFEIAKLGQLALTVEDIHSFMKDLIEIVQKSLKTEYVKILELTPDQTKLKLIEGVGWHDGIVGNAYVDVDYSSQAGYTLINNKPIIVKNFAYENRFSAPLLLKEHNVVAGISITIFGKSSPFGILGAHTKKERDFTDDDINFMHSVSYILSSVLIQHESINKLRSEEEKYRILMEYASEGIFLSNDKGIISDVNSKACEMTGYTKKELIGEKAIKLFSKQELDKIPFKIDDVLQGKDPFLDRNLLRKDGTEIAVEISANLLPNGTIQAIYRDITSRKKAETMLRNIQVMDTVGRISGGLAHDINNALSVISGISQKILIEHENNLDKTTIDDLNRIMKVCEKNSVLTRNLLNFSKKKFIEKKICNVNELIKDLQNSLVNVLPKTISLDLYLSKDDLIVETNPDQVQHSILNLVINSRDAIYEYGKITINTSVKVIDEPFRNYAFDTIPGEYISISISDNGSGMSEEVKSHLFEPFFSTKSEEKGTGLGLASIYGFIREEKGFITIETELQKGTTITLFLPKLKS